MANLLLCAGLLTPHLRQTLLCVGLLTLHPRRTEGLSPSRHRRSTQSETWRSDHWLGQETGHNRATQGLLSQLAMSPREMWPSSMHTPWAESIRYKTSVLMSFTAERLPSGDSPSLPFCVRFNEPIRRRRQHYGFTASYRLNATLDNGPLAKSYSGGSHTHLSSNHFKSARATLGYAFYGRMTCSAETFVTLRRCNLPHDHPMPSWRKAVFVRIDCTRMLKPYPQP